MRRIGLLLVGFTLVGVSVTSEGQIKNVPVVVAPPPPGSSENVPDEPVIGHSDGAYEDYVRTPKEQKELAWITLTKGVTDASHPEVRIQALAALSELGANEQAQKLIEKALTDSDAGVRQAAALAEASAKGAEPTADSALGPFGLGAATDDYVRKHGVNVEKMAAVDALAKEHTAETRRKLLADLNNKDLGVKVAAARGLVGYPGVQVAAALDTWLKDGQAPVRLTAAASLLKVWAAMTPAAGNVAKH